MEANLITKVIVMETQKGQIFELIPKIMKEIGSIGKNRKNQQQGYSFRGIDDAYNALAGPLADNGVFIVPEVLDTTREQWQTKAGGNMFSVMLKAAFTFFAPDGSSIRAVTAGEGMDTGDKATNKAMSAALKYAMLDVFCIPTEEPKDSENDNPEPAKKIGGNSGSPKSEFEVKVEALLAAREFTVEEIANIKSRIIKKKKVGNISRLPASEQTALITAIESGAMDKFKGAAKAA